MITSLKNKAGFRKYIGPKRLLIMLILMLFVSLIWASPQYELLKPDFIHRFIYQYPISSVFLFLLIYLVSVIALLPALPLNLAAGFFWGGLLGGLYTAIGATLGGWCAFAIARWLLGQPLTGRFSSQWVTKIQTEFAQHGWKFVALARINPVIPSGPLNYLLGLTSLSSRGFLLTTFAFLLPPSIAIAYVGDTLQTFSMQQANASEMLYSILILSGAVTSLILIKFIANYYRSSQETK